MSNHLSTLFLLFLSLAGGARGAEVSTDLSYEITAALDLTTKVVRSRAVITIPANLMTSPNEVCLDALSAGAASDGKPLMTIRQVAIEGSLQSVSWVAAEGIVHVKISEPVGMKQGIRLAIDYSVPLDEESRKAFGYYVFMGDEPGSLWYPDVVGPGGSRSRFKDFAVKLAHPAGVTVMTSGAPEAIPSSQAPTIEESFVGKHLEGFALCMGDGFTTTRVVDGDLDVTVFSTPDLADTYTTAARYALDAMLWYRKTYGFLPVTHIGLLQGHQDWGGGFPLPNLFMVHRGRTDVEFLQWIVAHELGHYYWGLYVLGDGERLDWLELANGIWADQLYMAQRAGRSIEAQWRRESSGGWFIDYVSAQLGNHDQRLGITSQEEQRLGFDYNSLVRHAKGAVGVYLLARRIGTDKFLALQRGLLTDYAYRPLPVSEFARRLEAAGAAGATDFITTWVRGDATLGFSAAIESVRHDAEGYAYTVAVTRTGNVLYPLTLAFRSAAGQVVRREIEGDNDTENIDVRLTAPLTEISLDPDGVLPIWNSSHPEIRKVFLRALLNEQLITPCVELTRAFLAEYPEDPGARALLARCLFDEGRYEDVITTVTDHTPTSCEDMNACRSLIYLARSLMRVGRVDEAARLLGAVRDDCARVGARRQLQKAADELDQLKQ